MDENIPHAYDLFPGDIRTLLPHAVGKFCRRLTDNGKLTDNGVLNQRVGEKTFLPLRAIDRNLLDRGEDVLQIDPGITLGCPHNGRASARIYSRNAGLILFSETTSTFLPTASSRSIFRPERLRRVKRAGSFTSRSTSLDVRCSLRANDPKTRTLRTPCLRATDRIAGRSSLMVGSLFAVAVPRVLMPSVYHKIYDF